VTDQHRYPQRRSTNIQATASRPLRHIYIGITGLLLVIVVALVGGIIWYNSKKSNELAIAAAERLMVEVGEEISARIKLLYDPMYAIVGVSSLVPELTTPAIKEDSHAISLMQRVLQIYPQILSLYVGFDNGDFFMITHIAGENGAALRDTLHAPQNAAFANEIISNDAGGNRSTRWTFIAEDGTFLGHRDAVEFDPRTRPWYDSAKRSDRVEQSDLYIFASSGKPGFTLSRSFAGQTPGVIGADLAGSELSRFLHDQHITPEQHCVHFHEDGRGDRSSRPDPNIPSHSLWRRAFSQPAEDQLFERPDHLWARLGLRGSGDVWNARLRCRGPNLGRARAGYPAPLRT
jgi:adenylate cyclase